MVRLNKIYTRTGDDGTTGLVGGTRVPKDSARVEAYGSVDEANSSLGLAVVECARDPRPRIVILGELLAGLQQDLFDLGADLATVIEPKELPGTKLRITPAQTTRLESLIDLHNEGLASLTSFVLPGGCPAAAALHHARTVARRAERRGVTLASLDQSAVNPEAIRYLNRLSDLLFVLARVANDDEHGDVLWVPGVNRSDPSTS